MEQPQPSEISLLIEKLKSGDPDERLHAIAQLEEINSRDEIVNQALAEAACNDPDLYVRGEARYSLIKLKLKIPVLPVRAYVVPAHEAAPPTPGLASKHTPAEKPEVWTVDGEEDEQVKPAGFWRRLLAFSLDIAILAIPLFVIGFVFRDWAYSLGPKGRWIGYAALVLYWGILDSRIGHGQTLGKKVTGILVVDWRSNFLSLGNSFERAVIPALAGWVSSWVVAFNENPLVAALAGMIVFGLGLAILYGPIFNRETRQGIHDFIAGAYVIRAPRIPRAIAPNSPRIHRRMMYALLACGLVIGIAGAYATRYMETSGAETPALLENLQNLQTDLMDTGNFFSVNVTYRRSTAPGGAPAAGSLVIVAWADQPCTQNPKFCNHAMLEIARIALEKYQGINQLAGMSVSVKNAFDFGLATNSMGIQNSQSIDGWREQTQLPPDQ